MHSKTYTTRREPQDVRAYTIHIGIHVHRFTAPPLKEYNGQRDLIITAASSSLDATDLRTLPSN